MSGPVPVGEPVPVTDAESAVATEASVDPEVDETDGTAIFGDEQDVAATKAPALPLIGALVAVGLVVGVLVGIVAVVSAPVWTVAIGSLVAGNQGGTTSGTSASSGDASGDSSGNSSGVDAAALLELPNDAVVIASGEEQVDGVPQSTAQVSFSADPAPLLEGAGYSASADVPRDLLDAQGADFADPRFYVVFVGDTPFTALVGSTSDGRFLAALTGPVLAAD